ncbi:hypothetical protein V8J82_03300 [Gymnodinialimonas sp. 2305UL16-5]|uniref:hypothetical protein n=1 Tax=Gymnodinialimonas mytili TaxID=3126503 RepID=UPI0030B23F57
MQTLNDMWLRGQAAQHSILQLATYNAAFVGTAGMQVMRAGWTGPQTFWAAMARATAQSAPAPSAAPKRQPAAAKPKTKAVPVKAAPASVVEAKPANTPAPSASKKKPAKAVVKAPITPDDLTQLKGVGATLAIALNKAGIETFAQLSKLTPKRIDKLDESQKGFKMIAARYKLVDQAKALAK